LANPQKAAGAALQGWGMIWGDPLDHRAPWLQPPTALEWADCRTRPLTPRQVLEACGRCKHTPGLGESGWHPRLRGEGGAHGAARIASVLKALEAGTPWPQEQDTILCCLMAKAAGGFRNLRRSCMCPPRACGACCMVIRCRTILSVPPMIPRRRLS
jgi:hypothetical protein